MKYKLTSPSENPPEFPTNTTNLAEAIAAPVLNQPASLVVVNSLIEGFKDYNIKTPLKLTWPFLWLGNSLRNKQMSLQYLAPGHVPSLKTYDDYAAFLDEYREKQRVWQGFNTARSYSVLCQFCGRLILLFVTIISQFSMLSLF